VRKGFFRLEKEPGAMPGFLSDIFFPKTSPKFFPKMNP